MTPASLFEYVGDLSQYWPRFVDLCIRHPVLGVLLSSVCLIFGVYVAGKQVIGLGKQVKAWSRSPKLVAFAIAGLAPCFLLSYLLVYSVREDHAPRPVLTASEIFLGRQVLLKWCDPDSLSSPSVPYEIESAVDSEFTADVKREFEFFTGALGVISRNINGFRYWRVRRAAGGESGEPVGLWSEPIGVAQYEDVLAKIRSTGRLVVVTSNSFNKTHFRFFLGGRLTGFDIELVREIASRLTPLLGLSRPIDVVFVPVLWKDVLTSPSEGRADLVASTITRVPARERTYGLRFLAPYHTSSLALIYRADREVSSLERLSS
jgi:ABC-type amino acid transport substrate-binding protein